MHRRVKRTMLLRGATATGAIALGLLVFGGLPVQAQQSSPATAPARPAAAVETWDVTYIAGAKAGYNHTTRREIVEAGQPLVRFESQSQMSFLRQGQSISIDLRATCYETPTGQLRRFETQANLGPVPTVARGRVEGQTLHLELTTQGKTTRAAVPWPAGAGGFFASEESLRRRPLRPGETRRVKALLPVFNVVAEVTLSAADFETTELLGGAKARLLKIDTQTTLPGQQPLPAALWTNQGGDTLKSREAALNQVTFRTTRDVALGKPGGPPPDVTELSVVRVDPAPRRPHDAQRMVYRVTLKEGDPARVFPGGASQSVRSLGPHEAEITVRAVRPGDGHAKSPGPKPTDADRRPNNLIQSDDPAVLAMARQPAPGETDPWRLAVALEKYVHRSMRLADYSQALASAAEVAKSRQGDCTEFSVLLAALARARGIPARLAVGLVYSPESGGFAFHMWDEVWISDEWLPLDATLSRGGLGGGHLKLADTNAESGGPEGFLSVYRVMGQLGIKVVEEKR